MNTTIHRSLLNADITWTSLSEANNLPLIYTKLENYIWSKFEGWQLSHRCTCILNLQLRLYEVNRWWSERCFPFVAQTRNKPLNFWSLSTRVFSAPHSTDGHALGSFHAGIWWLDQTTDQIIVVPCHRSSYIHWAQVTSCSFALIYQILCFLWPWSRWNFVFIPTFVTSYSFFTIASIFIYPYHFVWIAL